MTPARPDWLQEGHDPDYRFSLANERTFLAWIRTSLAMTAAAVAVVQLIPAFRIEGARTVLGALLAASGLGTAVLSYKRWAGNERAMRTDAQLPHTRGLVVLSGALTVLGGAVLLLALFASK